VKHKGERENLMCIHRSPSRIYALLHMSNRARGDGIRLFGRVQGILLFPT
jgi:hypothetical protein